MELSPPLRWLGALAVMVIVLLIVVPMLLRTVGDTVVLGGDATEVPSEPAVVPSEIAEAQPAADSADAADDSGGDAGGDDDGIGDDDAAGDEFPTTYTVVAGDTGTAISRRFYDADDGWAAIAQANDIDPSAPLRVGVELTIPAPE